MVSVVGRCFEKRRRRRQLSEARQTIRHERRSSRCKLRTATNGEAQKLCRCRLVCDLQKAHQPHNQDRVLLCLPVLAVEVPGKMTTRFGTSFSMNTPPSHTSSSAPPTKLHQGRTVRLANWNNMDQRIIPVTTDKLKRLVLHVFLDNRVREPAPNHALRFKDRVLEVHRDLVLGSTSVIRLFRGECNGDGVVWLPPRPSRCFSTHPFW